MDLFFEDRSARSGRSWPAARRRFVALAVAIVIVAAACSSASPSEDVKTSQGVGTPTTAAASPTNPDAASGVSMCDQPVTLSGFDIDAAAAVPLVDATDGQTELGASGVAEILDQLEAGVVGLCALDVSPWVVAAIAEIDKAAAAGDQDEVRRLLEQLIRSDLSAWAPMVVGISASDGVDHEQRARDAMKAAETAMENGESDLGDEAAAKAAAEYRKYVEGSIGQTNDVGKLIEMAETSGTIGDYDTMDMVIAKLLEIFEKELAKLIKGYDVCDATSEQSTELMEAAALVGLFGGDYEMASQLLLEYMDIERRRAAGEPVPECDSYSFTADSPFAGWDGAMTLDLATCDGLTWTGMMTVDATMSSGGGSFTTTGYSEVKITFPSMTSEAESPLTVTQYLTMKVPDGKGTIDGEGSGKLKMTIDVDTKAVTATVVVDAHPATATLTIEGDTISMTTTVEGGSSTFEGVMKRKPSCEEGG